MSDDSSRTARAGADGEPGGRLWQGLKTLLFGTQGEPTLREQIEDVIDGAPSDARGRGASGDTDLTPIERQMVKNLLHFGEMRVDDIAVPRADIQAISETAEFSAVVAAFAEAGHSRMPVYRENLDTIIGMIHIRDVFAYLATGQEPPTDLSGLLRQPRYVPQSMGVLDLLAEMRATRTHLAIVIDEYSGTEGLVTIEDIVEQIVGDIEDEHDDEPETLVRLLEPGLWECDARIELDDLAEAVGDPALADMDEEADTLGGVAFALTGHVPKPGEVIAHPSGWRIEITESDERRVVRARLLKPEKPEFAPAEK